MSVVLTETSIHLQVIFSQQNCQYIDVLCPTPTELHGVHSDGENGSTAAAAINEQLHYPDPRSLSSKTVEGFYWSN